MFYGTNIESTLRYGSPSLFGNHTVKFKAQVFNLVKTAGNAHLKSTIQWANRILSNPTHVLNTEYVLMNF